MAELKDTIIDGNLTLNGNLSISNQLSITGAIVDDFIVDQSTGSSSIDAYYRKWNSGLSEFWAQRTFINIDINTPFGGTYYSGNFGNVSFVSDLFVDTPMVFVQVQDGTYGCWLMRGSLHPSATQTGAQNACRGTAVTIPSLTLIYYAVGRWK